MILRAIEPEDVDFLFLLENDPEVASQSSTTAPMSRQMLWRYANEYRADLFGDKEIRFIITDPETGNAAGTIDITSFNPRDRRGFAGIAIAPQYRGHGLGTRALRELSEMARKEFGMHQLAAIVAYDNTASRHLFAKAGFTQCGQLRSWIRHGDSYRDAALLQKLLVD